MKVIGIMCKAKYQKNGGEKKVTSEIYQKFKTIDDIIFFDIFPCHSLISLLSFKQEKKTVVIKNLAFFYFIMLWCCVKAKGNRKVCYYFFKLVMHLQNSLW